MIQQTDFETSLVHVLGLKSYLVFLGVDQHLIEKILDPAYLDGIADTFSGLRNILKSSGTSARAWVGEAGGAYNSGHPLVTNAFVFSFW